MQQQSNCQRALNLFFLSVCRKLDCRIDFGNVRRARGEARGLHSTLRKLAAVWQSKKEESLNQNCYLNSGSTFANA